MKMIVTTTITTTFDPGTMEAKHSVSVEDEDGVHEISSEVLWACVLAGARSVVKRVEEDQPRLARLVDEEASAMHDEDEEN